MHCTAIATTTKTIGCIYIIAVTIGSITSPLYDIQPHYTLVELPTDSADLSTSYCPNETLEL